MSDLLTECVVLVTGAQQGIGRATALALADDGAAVIVNWLDDEAAAREVVNKIVDSGGRAVDVQGDVTRRIDIEAMLDLGNAWGGVNTLINNAAIFPRVPFLEMSEREFDAVIDVNLKGSFQAAQAMSQRVVKQKAPGVIVNIVSGAAWYGSPSGAHYVASKAGLVGLTRALALELAPFAIRVNAIAPGLTDTAQPRYGMSESDIEDAATRVPLGRIGRPDDVAGTACFLVGERASHITGQTFHVNGGQILR